jgi:hypothetical protein
MTGLSATATPHGRPPAQVTDRFVHTMRIMLCRKNFTPSTDTPGHHLCLGIWLAGWCVAIHADSHPVATSATTKPQGKQSN